MTEDELSWEAQPKWFRVRVELPAMEGRPRATTTHHNIHAMSEEDLMAGIPAALHEFVTVVGLRHQGKLTDSEDDTAMFNAKATAETIGWAAGRGVRKAWRWAASKDAR
ncbi:hypothetical protein [Amycolatopsis sp. Poz14]|uniref:hypothetical protein n=1 Tax=Amycolatopsis sp. Poz14 TaxID=1447705 RepID=UPI001EE8E0EE|nr:hypothetical protein [Amycolatopsis sp. Poz14]MCG3756679.1 hypothetical protein [Amycolatopsis sp. Poz14]